MAGGRIAAGELRPNDIYRFRVNFRTWAIYDSVRCSEKLSWYTRQSYEKLCTGESGTATAGTASTLTDSTKNWVPGSWGPGAIKIHSGTGAGQVRQVAGNTETVIMVMVDWGTWPDNTSVYELISTFTWKLWNDVANDNESADGTTNITWNLQ